MTQQTPEAAVLQSVVAENKHTADQLRMLAAILDNPPAYDASGRVVWPNHVIKAKAEAIGPKAQRGPLSGDCGDGLYICRLGQERAPHTLCPLVLVVVWGGVFYYLDTGGQRAHKLFGVPTFAGNVVSYLGPLPVAGLIGMGDLA